MTTKLANLSYIGLLLFLAAAAAVHARIIFIDPVSGTDNAQCTPSFPCATLPHALNLSHPADEIVIQGTGAAPLLIFETIVIAHNITLRGAQKSAIKILMFDYAFVVSPDASVALVNLLFQQTTHEVVHVTSAALTFDGCEFESSTNILTALNSKINISNCVFNGNNGFNSNASNLISLVNCQTLVANSLFSNNGNFSSLIHIQGASGPTLMRDSVFENNEQMNTLLNIQKLSYSVSLVTIQMRFNQFVNTESSTPISPISIVQVNGYITMDHCKFISNRGNSTIVSGALYLRDIYGTVSISNSQFLQNKAIGSMASYGAIMMRNIGENLTVTNSTLQNNTAQAICEQHSSCVSTAAFYAVNIAHGIVHNCTVNNNVATAKNQVNGAVLFSNSQEIHIEQSNIENNNCSCPLQVYGGGLTFISIGKLRILNVLFNSNVATIFGGGLFVLNISDFQMNHSRFTQNVARQGGGLYANQVYGIGARNTAIIESCIFENNEGVKGGAILFSVTYAVILTHSKFIANKAKHVTRNGEDIVGGGAIFFEGQTALVFDNPILGILSDIFGVYLSNCFFERNIASSQINNQRAWGGAIVVTGSQFGANISGCTFNGNTADEGGAFYSISDIINIENSYFSNNSANKGGAMVLFGKETFFHKVSVEHNSATIGGGAFISCLEFQANYGSFNTNIAQETGGGMHIAPTTKQTLSKVIFSTNTARKGGGIFVEAYDSVLNSVIFQENAANIGGATFISSPPQSILNIPLCQFKANNASITGNDMYIVSNIELRNVPRTLIPVSEPNLFVVTDVPEVIYPGISFNIRGYFLDTFKNFVSLTFIDQLGFSLQGENLLKVVPATILTSYDVNFLEIRLRYTGNNANISMKIATKDLSISIPVSVTVKDTCYQFYTLIDGVCAFNTALYALFSILFVPIIFILATIICIQCLKKRISGLKKYSGKQQGDLLLDMHLEEDKDFDISKINTSVFEIDFDEICDIKQLGQGGSGALIVKAVWRRHEVAVKLFPVSLVNSQYFEHEIKMLNTIHHKNIVSCYGACLRPPRFGIVMEYCSQGTLTMYILKNKNHIPFRLKVSLLQQIASGDNVLMDEHLTPKISDFGTSKLQSSAQYTKNIGTGFYMAPELVLQEFYDEKVDVFSFSIVMFEMLVETDAPYGSTLSFNIEYTVSKNPLFRPMIPVAFEVLPEHHWYLELMSNCWKHNPKDRPSFSDIVEILSAKYNSLC